MSKVNMKHLSNFQQMKQDDFFISDTNLCDYELPNGDYYKGSYDSDGFRHGYGLYMFRDGMKYLGNYHHGLRSGYGVMAYSDGSKYAGTWLNNLKQGYGRYTYLNGDVYEGQWYENKRHGIGSYYYTCNLENHSFYGTWVNGQRCGPAEINVKAFQLYAIYKDHCPVGPALFTFGKKWMCSGYFLKEMILDKSSSSFWVPQKISRFDSKKIPQRPEPDIDLDQIEIISSTSSFSSWLFSVINSEAESSPVSKSPSIKSISEALDLFKIVDGIASSIIRLATMQGEHVPRESMTKLQSVILSLKSFLNYSESSNGRAVQLDSKVKSRSLETDQYLDSIRDNIRREDSQGPFLDSVTTLASNIEFKSRVSLSSHKESSLSSFSNFKANQRSKTVVSGPIGRLSDISELDEQMSTATESFKQSLRQIDQTNNTEVELMAAYSDTESVFAVLNKFQIIDDITNSIIKKVLNPDTFFEDIKQMRTSHSNIDYILDIILMNVVANKSNADL